MNGNPKSDRSLDPRTIRRLLGYLSRYRVRLVLVTVCILLSALAGVASSLFLETLIDDYIAPLLLEAVPDYSGLLRAVLSMGGIYLAGVLAALFYNRLMVVIAQGALKHIRDEMFAHMQTLPIGYFDTHPHGDVMSHYTNDIDTLRQMISQSVPHTFSSLVSLAAALASMLYLSVWMTLIVAVFVVVLLRVVGFIAKQSGTHFFRRQQAIADVNGYVEEMISGQKVVKVFCRERQSSEEFDRLNEVLRGSTRLANQYANILMPITQSMGYLLYVLLAVLGGAMALWEVPNLGLSGQPVITLGMIASFLQLSRSFVNPIAQISQQLNAIVMALAGAARIFALLDEKPEADSGDVTLVNVTRSGDGTLSETTERTGLWAWKQPEGDGFIYTPLAGSVTFDNVDFDYIPEKTVLHDITLYAHPGQKIAFVGATGAGKTTITNLINRFYDIADGKIRYDGININRIRKSDLRRSLGVVLQDVNLFSGTVMENIRFGRLDATDEECVAAARLANADSFIRMLPQGYQTVLSGDGSGLSQGQRQLISIARAAVADPPVMVLDEATSSIDTRTEAIVQRGMDSLMQGRTVFVIAHRLSTIKNANVIMVLERGRIIERGNHEQLLAERGHYYQLYTGAVELD